MSPSARKIVAKTQKRLARRNAAKQLKLARKPAKRLVKKLARPLPKHPQRQKLPLNNQQLASN